MEILKKKTRKFGQIDIMKNSVVVAVSTTSLVSGRKLKAHEGIRHAVFSSGRVSTPHPASPLHPRHTEAILYLSPSSHRSLHCQNSIFPSGELQPQLNLHYSLPQLITSSRPLNFKTAFRPLSLSHVLEYGGHGSHDVIKHPLNLFGI